MERETPCTPVRPVRIKPMMRGVGAALTVILCCLCGGGAAAQDSGFSVAKVPGGRVFDEDGKPVHGARVWVRVETTSARYPRARNQILQRQRLPVVFTSRDGSFVLPLTRAQRSLSTPLDGYFSLVVEKSGYQTWIEPLGAGLRGYLGSRVTLRRIRPEDRFRVRVRDWVPGMKLLVRRHASPSQGNQPHVSLTRVIDVPEGGELEVAMPLVPSPRVIVSTFSYVPLSRVVQLLYPGRSTKPIAVRLGQKAVDIPAKKATGTAPRVVANDNKPMRGLRGLYRCPDGKHRWFQLPDGTLPKDSILHHRAVTAEGCVIQTALGIHNNRLVLQRARSSASPPSLRILGKDRRPLAGAVVSCYRLTVLRDVHNPWYGPGTAWRVLRTDVNGEVDLREVVDREPSVLLIEAPGHNRQYVQQPRSIVGRREISLGPGNTGSLELTLETSEGTSLAGAYLRFPDNCYTLGGILDRIPRTDAKGTIRVDHLPKGSYSVQIVGDGVIDKFVRVQFRKPWSRRWGGGGSRSRMRATRCSSCRSSPT